MEAEKLRTQINGLKTEEEKQKILQAQINKLKGDAKNKLCISTFIIALLVIFCFFLSTVLGVVYYSSEAHIFHIQSVNRNEAQYQRVLIELKTQRAIIRKNQRMIESLSEVL